MWKSHFWTWHPFTRFVSRLENSLVSWSYSYKITNRSVILVVESVFPRQLSCRQYVQKDVQPGKPSISLAISVVFKISVSSTIPELVLNNLLLWHTSCYLFCVIDVGYIKALLWWVFSCWLQLIIQELDLETNWYLGTCMPQWQVSSLSIGVFIIDPWSGDSVECSTSTHKFTPVGLY